MVGLLTVGKKKYADVELEMYDLCETCERLRMELLALVEEDAEVFLPLSRAYGMSAETEEEKGRLSILRKWYICEDCEFMVQFTD